MARRAHSKVRYALCAGLLFWAAAASAQESEKISKKQVSANGLYTVYLRENPDKSCLVVALKDGAPFWQLQQCVGSATDLYFISNDGQRFWVVRPLAKIQKAKKKNPWGDNLVLQLYNREGEVKSSHSAGALVPRLAWGQVRELGGHVKWVEGVNGVAGKPPRVNDDNQLEVDPVGVTIGLARTMKFSFSEGKSDEKAAAPDAGVAAPKETK
ncbi:MAG: hypothetical protein ACJ790_01690 [Myxococcaceae bacterium]